MDEKKWEIVVNLLTLVPLVLRGIQEAEELYNRMLTGLKDGLTPEEWADALQKRDDVLARLVEKTAG
jgi:hypothetical protein